MLRALSKVEVDLSGTINQVYYTHRIYWKALDIIDWGFTVHNSVLVSKTLACIVADGPLARISIHVTTRPRLVMALPLSPLRNTQISGCSAEPHLTCLQAHTHGLPSNIEDNIEYMSADS